MLNTFRLGARPSSHYLSLFEVSPIKLKNTGYPERSFGFRPAVATIGKDGDERQFDIVLVATDGAVEQASIATAKALLAQIVEMDDAARALEPYIQDGKPLDHDEVLARVVIQGDDVRFRYFATTVNTEWDVDFERMPSGDWVCRGISDPK